MVGASRLRPRRLLKQRPSRRPSATTIVADLQHLEVDQWVPMLASSADGDPRGLAHGVRRFAMTRRMLRGVKTRAESVGDDRGPPLADVGRA